MSRIGGAFPFPTAQVQEGGGRLAIGSGQYFYMGPGEFIIQTGALTVIEWFDPIDQVWRTQLNASSGDFIPCDGVNWRLHNISGTVTGLTITGAGSGGTNGIGTAATNAAVGVTAAPAGGRTAIIVPIVGGSVQAPTITQAGSGFTVAPLIVIDPPPGGGIAATAYASVSGGVITAITMVSVGAGYQASPNFWIIPQTAQYQGGPAVGVPAGSTVEPGLVFPTNAVPGNQNTSPVGAQLTSNALTGSGTLTGLKIIDAGAGYTASPTLTITGITAATATATVGNTTPAVDTSFQQPRVQ
jgi:hypothetical protein